MMNPKPIAISETDGSSAFGTAWRRMISRSRNPFARAVVRYSSRSVSSIDVRMTSEYEPRYPRVRVATGQHQVPRPIDDGTEPRVVGRGIGDSARREPAELGAKEGQEQHAEEELGGAVQRHRRRCADLVEAAAAQPSRSDADPQADADRQHGRDADQQQGVGQAVEDLAAHRLGSNRSCGRSRRARCGSCTARTAPTCCRSRPNRSMIAGALLLAQLAATPVSRQRVTVDDAKEEEVEHQHHRQQHDGVDQFPDQQADVHELFALVVASLASGAEPQTATGNCYRGDSDAGPQRCGPATVGIRRRPCDDSSRYAGEVLVNSTGPVSAGWRTKFSQRSERNACRSSYL